jgi:hypothetical protein
MDLEIRKLIVADSLLTEQTFLMASLLENNEYSKSDIKKKIAISIKTTMELINNLEDYIGSDEFGIIAKKGYVDVNELIEVANMYIDKNIKKPEEYDKPASSDEEEVSNENEIQFNSIDMSKVDTILKVFEGVLELAQINQNNKKGK